MWILQILVGLLKIIGIVLLGIFCIVLLLILLVLFGAIRYQVEGSTQNRESTGQVLLETLRVNAKVSWLNPLFRVFVQVKGKRVAYQVKVFGFCIVDSEKPRQKKPPKAKKPKQETATEIPANASTDSDNNVKLENSDVEESKETVLAQEETKTAEIVQEEKPTEQVTDISSEDAKTAEPLPGDEPSGNQKTKKKAKKEKKAAVEEAGEKKKFSFTELKEKIVKLKEKKDLIMEFLQEETTKLTIAGTFRTIKKVILHILPVSVRGNIIYGSGDPASTGKAFAVFGILYAKYGESLTVLADFEEKRLEADVQIKGRIRLGTMAWYFIIFVLKKETRAFIKRCMQLIKKLKA